MLAGRYPQEGHTTRGARGGNDQAYIVNILYYLLYIQYFNFAYLATILTEPPQSLPTPSPRLPKASPKPRQNLDCAKSDVLDFGCLFKALRNHQHENLKSFQSFTKRHPRTPQEAPKDPPRGTQGPPTRHPRRASPKRPKPSQSFPRCQ